MGFTYLINILLAFALAGCGKGATVEILQTTNISSKVTAVCSGAHKIIVSDVSGDGSVVVGKWARKEAPNYWQVFLYSQSSGVKNLGSLGKKSIDNLHISADGLVIWGTFYVENEGSHIVRYTQRDGLQDLGTMGKKAMSVKGVSADGSWIVGNIDIGTSSKSSVRNISSHVFRYSLSSGKQNLGTTGWAEDVFATGISNDGAVIVGYARFMIGFIVSISKKHYLFVYTEKGGMQKLEKIGWGGPRVTRISGDGTRLFGSYRKSNGDSYIYTTKLVLQ